MIPKLVMLRLLRSLALGTVLLVCFGATHCRAQDLELNLPAWVQQIGLEPVPQALLGADRFDYVAKGAPAPYEGILFDMATASRWTLRLDWVQKQLKLDADMLRSIMKHEVDMRVTIIRANEESRKREIEGLRKDLRSQASTFAAAQQVPFYRTATFGFITGAVLTGALAATIAVAAH